MKKYTVMLIPHDRGGTRTLTMCGWHGWGAFAVLAVLAFGASFFYMRQSTFEERFTALQNANAAQEDSFSRLLSVPQNDMPEGLSEDDVAAIERRIREEYENRTAVIAASLSELYDEEAKIREIQGLPPRTQSIANQLTVGPGGQGGPESGLAEIAEDDSDALARPPQMIYGLSRPSADLILQEINIRTESLQELYTGLEKQRDKAEHTPAILPVKYSKVRFTSSYGQRRDPFTRRVRFHSGLDMVAPYGTKIVATANGRVVESGYDSAKGNYVVIDHGYGYQTVYMHMSKRLVKKWQDVERGDVIGNLGSTGRSTGAHLHYEVHVNGKTTNPRKYLGD